MHESTDRDNDDSSLPRWHFQPSQTPDETTDKTDEKQTKSLPEPVPRPLPSPQGIYLHGHVGSGKSMLMDMFFDCVTTTPHSTRHLLDGATNENTSDNQIVAVRTHFQPFMVELLQTLHNWRLEERESRGGGAG